MVCVHTGTVCNNRPAIVDIIINNNSTVSLKWLELMGCDPLKYRIRYGCTQVLEIIEDSLNQMDTNGSHTFHTIQLSNILNTNNNGECVFIVFMVQGIVRQSNASNCVTSLENACTAINLTSYDSIPFQGKGIMLIIDQYYVRCTLTQKR